MGIQESDLPGVGKKHEIDLEDGSTLIIITHNTGRRDVYRRDSAQEDSKRLFALSDKLARTVGTILEGAYFQPEPSTDIGTMLSDEMIIEWYDVPKNSFLDGNTLESSNLRKKSGVTVVAIQREDELFSNPTPSTEFQSGDIIVVIGNRESCNTFESEFLSLDENTKS
ncbi:TrkA C-terminal domain-containing protein [Halalkaliarchaeum sp. AArc-GB]|uniref:cation:proton antiporter regulatory subunit n=1 Tax=Halalkaliarchaeum sp. AArc-GB TaxID=3074078 RepID=UPI00285BE508|nr:TrkA C-terminal domain-containing protein [Halalkaliarchaeum sp. AArc-GB]MDR5673586.1 TrkA C-terminal domain-containing protein [Halalkaliarchaeum sp. AArc-GB]